MSEPRTPIRDEEDPRERDLARRSNNPSVSVWLIVMAIALLGALVYVASAML